MGSVKGGENAELIAAIQGQREHDFSPTGFTQKHNSMLDFVNLCQSMSIILRFIFISVELAWQLNDEPLQASAEALRWGFFRICETTSRPGPSHGSSRCGLTMMRPNAFWSRCKIEAQTRS